MRPYYYRRHSIQIPACPSCPFFKPSTTKTTTQEVDTSQRRRRRSTTQNSTTTKTSTTKASSTIAAVDYSDWDAAMNLLLEDEGEKHQVSPSSSRRRGQPLSSNDRMIRNKSTRTMATSFTTSSTNIERSSNDHHHPSSIVVNNRVQEDEEAMYIYTIDDDESSISSIEDSICSHHYAKDEEVNRKEEDEVVMVNWERLERYIEQEDDIEDCFAYALDVGMMDIEDEEKEQVVSKISPKFASDGIIVGADRLEQMRGVRCPAA